jgi:hypothetical protein
VQLLRRRVRPPLRVAHQLCRQTKLSLFCPAACLLNRLHANRSRLMSSRDHKNISSVNNLSDCIHRFDFTSHHTFATHRLLVHVPRVFGLHQAEHQRIQQVQGNRKHKWRFHSKLYTIALQLTAPFVRFLFEKENVGKEIQINVRWFTRSIERRIGQL